MEQSSDYIEREVEKICSFLKKIILKLTKGKDVESSLKSYDNELKEKLDFSVYELIELNHNDLKNKLNGVNTLILEELLNIFYQLSKQHTFEFVKLKKVALILIEEIENKTLIYSIEREQIKNFFKSKN